MALIKCPECGKEVSDKSKACIHCGYPLECNIKENCINIKCEECGKEISKDENFCPYCGCPVTSNKTNTKECPECHTEVPLNAKECPNCAYPFTHSILSNIDKVFALSKNKKIIIIFGCFALIMLSVLFPFLINRDINKAKNSYKNDDISAFNIAKTRLDESDINEINSYLMEDIESVKKDYINGKITYNDAITNLERIIKYSDTKHLTNYNEVKTFINNLENSKTAFRDAQNNESAGDFSLAYDNYGRVIEDDINYEEAQNKMNELKNIVCQEYISKANDYAENEDYDNAISILNKAQKYDEANTDITSKINEYRQKQKEIKEKLEAEAREKAKLYEGKVITTDNAEITFSKAELTDHIYPNNRSGYYTYYSVNTTGITWLDIKLQVKNIGAGILNLNDMVQDVQAIYDGNLEYKTYGLYYSTGNRIDRIYEYLNNSINPLQEVTLHLVIEVPVEAKTSGKSLEAEFVLDGERQLLLLQ